MNIAVMSDSSDSLHIVEDNERITQVISLLIHKELRTIQKDILNNISSNYYTPCKVIIADKEIIIDIYNTDIEGV